jgi:hypothetical protein
MRRTLFLALVLLTAFAVAVPVADAQTPNPNAKVTISGLIDNVGTYTRNMSAYDFNLARNNDAQMYGRTRGRFDIIGEIGKAKAVLGIEIDSYWGQTGVGDSIGVGSTSCIAAGGSGSVTCAATPTGAESSFDLNTDTQSNLQVKWLYTEFPVPLIPVPTVMRLGAQPFGAAANYKLATYANGDFGGVNIVSQITPGFKLLFTYVAVEELLTGKKDFAPIFGWGVSGAPAAPLFLGGSTGNKCLTGGNASATACVAQSRGDDFAIIVSAEFSPFKGLDIKPMYSYFFASGLTSGAARQGRGGLAIAPTISGATGALTSSPFAPGGGATGWSADGTGTGLNEDRNTVGVDARFRSGPFSIDPTVMYQWGTRQAVNLTSPAYGTLCAAGGTGPLQTTCPRYTAKESAWLVDIRAGFQVGAFLFQGMYAWTSGDPASNNPYKHIGYFQPLDTDTSYLADWGTQITSLGVDYYQILNGGTAGVGLSPGVAIGYDKYGRHMFGLRANYAWTPALNTYALVTPQWTDRSVDRDSIFVPNGGLQPIFIDRKTGRSIRPEGDSNYIGTELDAGLTWRFADGLTFDFAVGWLLAGGALGHRTVGASYCTDGGAGFNSPAGCSNGNPKDKETNDVFITTARVRYVF